MHWAARGVLGLLAAGFLLDAGAAGANKGEWTRYAETAEYIAWYSNETLEGDARHRRVWDRVWLRATRRLDPRSVERGATTNHYRVVTAQHEFDCANYTSRVLQVVYYSNDGEMISKVDVPPLARISEPVTPGSAGWALRRGACAKLDK